MTIIILSIVLMAITATVIYVLEKKISKRMLFGLCWLILIPFSCFTIVPANNVGIKYNVFNGGIQNTTLGEGFILKSPFDKVYKLSTEVTELNFSNVTVQTADSQWVNTQLQVQVQIDPTKAFTYFKKYRDKSFNDIRNVIQSTVQKELEAISTKYNIMEILGEERSNIINLTSDSVKPELEKDGIILHRLILVDTEAGETIENAIANEAAAKKNAEAAKYLKEKAELEGEAKVIEARKENEANELKTKALTNAILTEKLIEKWDGKLPAVMSDNNNIFDISSLLGK